MLGRAAAYSESCDWEYYACFVGMTRSPFMAVNPDKHTKRTTHLQQRPQLLPISLRASVQLRKQSHEVREEGKGRVEVRVGGMLGVEERDGGPDTRSGGE